MKPSKPLRRYALKSPNDDAPEGHYKPGILNEGFAALFGRNISIWVHVEDLMIGVLQDLLGAGKRAPARQIFHSIVSNQARKSLLLTCLQRSKINAKKTDIYETILVTVPAVIRGGRSSYRRGSFERQDGSESPR